MTRILGRLAIVGIGIGWFVANRNFIYFYILGKGTAGREYDVFEWWWSWGMAIPTSLFFALMVIGALAVLGWVFDGSSTNSADNTARRPKPPTVQ